MNFTPVDQREVEKNNHFPTSSLVMGHPPEKLEFSVSIILKMWDDVFTYWRTGAWSWAWLEKHIHPKKYAKLPAFVWCRSQGNCNLAIKSFHSRYHFSAISPSDHRSRGHAENNGSESFVYKSTFKAILLGCGSNVFYFHPYLRTWSNLTSIFSNTTTLVDT